jgi:hypothetical protein
MRTGDESSTSRYPTAGVDRETLFASAKSVRDIFGSRSLATSEFWDVQRNQVRETDNPEGRSCVPRHKPSFPIEICTRTSDFVAVRDERHLTSARASSY